jgi:hypothetical protein
MVVVIGETLLAREIAATLAARSIDTALPATLDEIANARVIVVAEGVSRNDEDVERACRSIVVGGGTLVWVTTRPESDAALQAVRRKGIPYTIVRAGAVAIVPKHIEGRLVLVPSDLAPAPIAMPGDLAQATAELIAKDEVGTGRLVEVSSGLDARGWASTLRARGARPLVVPRWIAVLLGWLGLPRLEVGPGGVAIGSRRMRGRAARLPAPA